jgi:hypothetical protein
MLLSETIAAVLLAERLTLKAYFASATAAWLREAVPVAKAARSSMSSMASCQT